MEHREIVRKRANFLRFIGNCLGGKSVHFSVLSNANRMTRRNGKKSHEENNKKRIEIFLWTLCSCHCSVLLLSFGLFFSMRFSFIHGADLMDSVENFMQSIILHSVSVSVSSSLLKLFISLPRLPG